MGNHEVFLGRELGQRRHVSEHTARLVDQEVKRILDEAHDRARDVLEQHKELLESIAQALLERETLDRVQIETLERGDPLPPMAEPTPPTGATEAAARPAAAPAKPLTLPGGEGPLPGPAPGVVEDRGEEDLPL